MRLDLLLVRLRFAKSRSVAQHWIEEAHMRCNGERVTRADLPVATGDVLTLPIGYTVRVIAIESLPARRGPAAEARSHYRELDRNA
ncbi:S4 domain-containing protein [Aurantiacibacter sp. D1-12]|uniref:S4 domain-containing protein n=1 Tax=Aurantiacibacter sp. D1-12 TaxID=2993658 RepID=UPI00237D2F31|nr:S4 domain-containing protein [Aurantiacibacter sp. D1-12]MDE1468149.1 S4 domain-containing protein [Aurantiacibacter sp. D1-12]